MKNIKTMSIHSLKIALYVFFSLTIFNASTQLSSNDSTATVAAGSIEYKITDDISMDSEVLKVSTDNIIVIYKFTNHSNKDITVDVAFPLPPSPLVIGDTVHAFPSWDNLYAAYSYIDEAQAQSRSEYPRRPEDILESRTIANFKMTVNGKEGSVHSRLEAINKDGKDITGILRANKIPFSAVYLSGFMDEPVFERDTQIKKKLQDLNLLTKDGKLTWQTKVTYFWTQEFKAKKTIHTTHSYKPHRGLIWIGGDSVKELSDYNISKADLSHILGIAEDSTADGVLRAEEVRYVLSTGSNWKGPIKSFKLEITPPYKNCLVFTSFDGKVKKSKKGTYTCTIKNFKPRKDLGILFIKIKSNPHSSLR